MCLSINCPDLSGSTRKMKASEWTRSMEDELKCLIIVLKENSPEFIDGLKRELLKGGPISIKNMIRRLIPNKYKFYAVYTKIFSVRGPAADQFSRIVLELIEDDNQLLGSIDSSFVRVFKSRPLALAFLTYGQLAEILIEELICSKDVKEIQKALHCYWLPAGLSLLRVLDPLSAGPSMIPQSKASNLLEKFQPKKPRYVPPLSSIESCRTSKLIIGLNHITKGENSNHTLGNGGSSNPMEAGLSNSNSSSPVMKVVGPHLSGQLMGRPDHTSIRIEQDSNATDSKHTRENGGSSHHVEARGLNIINSNGMEAVSPLLMGLADGFISRMKQDSNKKEKLDKFWDKTNSNVFMLTAAAAGTLYVSKVVKPQLTAMAPSPDTLTASAASPDTITAIAVMIVVGFITSFLGLAVPIGDKYLTLVKVLTTVGATAAVGMVVMALAAVFSPNHAILTAGIACLFPILALINRAFSSNTSIPYPTVSRV